MCTDVLLVKGLPKKQRRTYKFWEEEGRAPSFVIEVTSLSTRDKDLRDKSLIDLKTRKPLLWEEEVREEVRRAAQAEQALRATEEELARRALEGRKPG